MRVLCACLLVVLCACKGEDLVPTEPAPPPPEPQPSAESRVLATATFRGANGYVTLGSATLAQMGDGQLLSLGDDFATDRSPALDVRLCRQRNCRGDDDIVLGTLRAFRGAQSYSVPGDGTGHAFVVIWCGAVELPFGTGRLQ